MMFKNESLPYRENPTHNVTMRKLNLFDFYKLGKVLETLASHFEDTPVGALKPTSSQALKAIEGLVEGRQMPLGTSQKSALEVLECVRGIVPKNALVAFLDERGVIRKIEFELLRNAINRFEIVFSEEMPETASYLVPATGIFATPNLIDKSDDCFENDIRSHIPEKALLEWREAGKCLAFNLWSASGFHVARSVESMMEQYYHIFTKKQVPQRYTWRNYIDDLGTVVPPAQKERTLEKFRQMGEDFRNPLMHPRITLKAADAKILFCDGESLITLMAQDIRARSLSEAEL